MYPERKCFQHCPRQFVLHLSTQAVPLGVQFPQFYHQLQHWCPPQTYFALKETVGAEYCYHILYQWSHFDLLKESFTVISTWVQDNHATHKYWHKLYHYCNKVLAVLNKSSNALNSLFTVELLLSWFAEDTLGSIVTLTQLFQWFCCLQTDQWCSELRDTRCKFECQKT